MTHHRLVVSIFSGIVRLISIGRRVAISFLVGSLRSFSFGQGSSLHRRVDVRRILEDESVQLVLDRDDPVVTTSLASLRDDFLLCSDEQVGLGVVALRTQNVFTDESVEQVLQFDCVVRSVNDETFVLMVELGLRSKFAAEELRGIGRGTVESLGDFRHVDDDSFDAVSFSFDLGADPRHFIAVVQVGDLAVDVQRSHGDFSFSLLTMTFFRGRFAVSAFKPANINWRNVRR